MHLMHKTFFVCALGLAASACLSTRPSSSVAQAPAATHGAAATAHPLATEAAIATLKRGGNAMDAAVAASFVISVVRPQSTGLGGGGFMLWHDAKSGAVEVFDFRERAPLAATPDMFVDEAGKPIPNASVDGHLAVGTPGLVAGLFAAQQKHGKLPWSELLAPAIAAAEDGFAVYPSLAEAMAERQSQLAAFPASRATYLRDGAPYRVGDTLRQPELAWTLRQVAARGAAGFYQGPVRDRLLAEMRRGHGLNTAADLDAYQVKSRAPVEGRYRGYRIASMPPPSSGGAHIVEMLNMLAGDDPRSMPQPAFLHLLAETMRRAFADRARWLGDPDFVAVPLKGLISPEYARARRQTIDLGSASRSDRIGAGTPPGAEAGKVSSAATRESKSTSHLSIIDGDGNAVATTQTVNYSFGSCVVAEGTGVVLNDEMDDFSIKSDVPNVFGLVTGDANAPAPGKTMLSSMSPSFVFGPDGKLVLALGSPGGPRIISATLQTIIGVIDFQRPLPAAVAAPRIHHQWLPDELRVEKGAFSPETLAALRAFGHTLKEAGPIGDVEAVSRDADGGLVAASDPRSEGVGLAY
jgi:gamma-glutamyltranspeptidase/glutathione hydrolase